MDSGFIINPPDDDISGDEDLVRIIINKYNANIGYMIYAGMLDEMTVKQLHEVIARLDEVKIEIEMRLK